MIRERLTKNLIRMLLIMCFITLSYTSVAADEVEGTNQKNNDMIYADKDVYLIQDIVTYGIVNNDDTPINVGTLTIQQSNQNTWIDQSLVTTTGILNPGETWEMTWFIDQLIQPGLYRIKGTYSKGEENNTGITHFTISPRATVFADKASYCRGETVFFGIKNTCDIPIRFGCYDIQFYDQGSWKNSLVINCVDFLWPMYPGDFWNGTWILDAQITAGSYRIPIYYYINQIKYTDYTYFSVLDMVLGDMNNDGQLNAGDIRYLAMNLCGDPQYMPLHAEGDVNNDGRLNSADIRYLAMYLVGDPAYNPLYP